MELVLGLVVGLILGLAAGASVVAVRAERERRRTRLAIDAELQAARQRAERATGEAEALRTKLAASEILGGRSVGAEGPARPEVTTPVAVVVTGSAPTPPARRPRRVDPESDLEPRPVPPATPVVAVEPVPVVAVESVPAVAVEPVPAVAHEPGPPATSSPRTRVSRPRPRPAADPPGADVPPPGTQPPPVGPAPEPEPVIEPAAAASTNGWRPIRPGLSDPHAWFGTPSPSGAPYGEDDLERIHGVGPYLARRLRDEGILTYRQIAEWSEDDMTLVSRRVGSFPDRVRREDWPASARELHAAVYGETLP